MTPHYEQAATLLKAKNIKLADVDCSEEADFCEAHEAQGFPYVCPACRRRYRPLTCFDRTLKIFRHGSQATKYIGPRQADGIVSYMLE